MSNTDCSSAPCAIKPLGPKCSVPARSSLVVSAAGPYAAGIVYVHYAVLTLAGRCDVRQPRALWWGAIAGI